MNSFVPILLSLCEKLATKLTCAVPLVLQGKIFALLGVVSIVSMLPTENKKMKPKSWRAKIYAQRTWRRAHVNFAAYFSQSESKIGKKRIHKIFAKYDKKQQYGPFFSFLD